MHIAAGIEGHLNENRALKEAIKRREGIRAFTEATIAQVGAEYRALKDSGVEDSMAREIAMDFFGEILRSTEEEFGLGDDRYSFPGSF